MINKLLLFLCWKFFESQFVGQTFDNRIKLTGLQGHTWQSLEEKPFGILQYLCSEIGYSCKSHGHINNDCPIFRFNLIITVYNIKSIFIKKKVNPDQNYFLGIHKQKQNRDGYIKFILKLLPHNINSLIEINRNKIKKKRDVQFEVRSQHQHQGK